MDKHTPGPWFVMAPNVNGEIDITAPDTDAPADDPWQVATVAGSCGYPSDQSPANARLIAAAPELLEWGAELLTLLDDYMQVTSLTANLRYAVALGEFRKAIARAEGRQSTSMEGGEG